MIANRSEDCRQLVSRVASDWMGVCVATKETRELAETFQLAEKVQDKLVGLEPAISICKLLF